LHKKIFGGKNTIKIKPRYLFVSLLFLIGADVSIVSRVPGIIPVGGILATACLAVDPE
jgi:hypothetical protein